MKGFGLIDKDGEKVGDERDHLREGQGTSGEVSLDTEGGKVWGRIGGA